METGLKIGSALVGAFMLSGCTSDDYPSKKITDKYAQKLLMSNDNDQDLVHTYHVMKKGSEGKELGVIFVNSVEHDKSTLIDCIKYKAFTSNPNALFYNVESQTRKTCVGHLTK